MKLKTVIRIFILSALLIGFSAPSAQASRKGEKVFGVRTGYVSRNNSMDVGLYFQYTFSDYFRLQPSADIVFRHNDRNAFFADLNAQVPIAISEDTFTLYPLAGLNFSSWNHHFSSDTATAEEELLDEMVPEWSARTNRFGANVGAGFDLKLSSTLKLSISATYTFVKSNSGVRVMAGIGYVF